MRHIRNAFLTGFGLGLLLLGIVGLFLPILHGLVFVILGLYFLSIGSPKTHTWIGLQYVGFKIRFPKTAMWLEKVEKKWEDMTRRWRKQ